jgi:hypothetical protein
MKRITLILSAVIIILIISVGGYFAYQKSLPPQTLVFNATQMSGWKTYTNSAYNFELKYPADFFSPIWEPKLTAGDCNSNVFPDACPNINDIVANDMIAGGGDIDAIKSNLAAPGYWLRPNGEKQMIKGVPYCLYTTSDAATGHVYKYYYFTTVRNQKCVVISFATSTANCDFYLPLETGNSQQETNYNNCLITNQNQPKILDQILLSFKFTN